MAYSFTQGTWRNATLLNESTVTTQQRPVTRGGQSVAEVNTSPNDLFSESNIALMFGGECHLTNHLGLPFRDTWTYSIAVNTTLFEFSPIVVTDYPQPLLSHRSVMVDGHMCMFGGLNLESGFNRDLFCLSYVPFRQSLVGCRVIKPMVLQVQ